MIRLVDIRILLILRIFIHHYFEIIRLLKDNLDLEMIIRKKKKKELIAFDCLVENLGIRIRIRFFEHNESRARETKAEYVETKYFKLQSIHDFHA